MLGQPNFVLRSACPNPTTCNISHIDFSLRFLYIHSGTHSLISSPNNLKLTKTCNSPMASLPQFYADFTFSGETSSQFHTSSSCPDVSALSNYIDDYGSFNTSPNPDSIFLPQLFGISDVSLLEYSNYYQKMGVNNNATQYFHGGDQEYYGFSPDIKPLFHPSTGEQTWVSMPVSF